MEYLTHLPAIGIACFRGLAREYRIRCSAHQITTCDVFPTVGSTTRSANDVIHLTIYSRVRSCSEGCPVTLRRGCGANTDENQHGRRRRPEIVNCRRVQNCTYLPLNAAQSSESLLGEEEGKITFRDALEQNPRLAQSRYPCIAPAICER
jgi:hypothetical protein